MMGANDGRRKAMILISAGIENVNLTDNAMHPPKNGLDPCFGGAEGAQITPAGGVPSSAFALKAMHCGGLNGMYDGLRRSSVAVYPVDPGGPKDRGASLDPVARETGGFAVHANDLEAGMAKLLADLDNYYLLGFYPVDPKDKTYHPLDVRVNRPGLTVRHRHGYQPGGPPPPPKNDKPLEQLVAPVMPKTDLPLRLGAVPLFGSGSKMQVLATLEIGVEAPAGAASPLVNDTIEFAVYAADLKKKKVTVSDARRLDVQWSVETEKSTGSFRVQSVLSLAPGPYQLRASAMSKTLDKTGSVYLQIDVPDLGDAPLALGGIALTPATTGQTTPGVLHTAALAGRQPAVRARAHARVHRGGRCARVLPGAAGVGGDRGDGHGGDCRHRRRRADKHPVEPRPSGSSNSISPCRSRVSRRARIGSSSKRRTAPPGDAGGRRFGSSRRRTTGTTGTSGTTGPRKELTRVNIPWVFPRNIGQRQLVPRTRRTLSYQSYLS